VETGDFAGALVAQGTITMSTSLRFRLTLAALPLIFVLLGANSWAQTSAVATTAAPQDIPATLDRRLTHFRHGINASHWFAQVYASEGYTKQHFETYATAEDMRLIKSGGFDHVRLSVNPSMLLNASNPERLQPDSLAQLKRAIAMVLDNGLAIVVDIHPEGDFKRRLYAESRFADAFVDFWRALAAELNQFDAERMLLEPLNEPEFEDRDRWNGLQARLIAAIRSGAPHHTILACGHRWSDMDEMLAADLVSDANVVYNFHYYDPHLFTHQGATWGTPFWRHLQQVPYPAAASPIMPSDDFPLARLALVRYAHEGWNRDRIEAEIGEAARWAARHHVRLTCNEFGVYRPHSAPEARAAWINDVRSALEHNGIGWTMWDYKDSFGVAVTQNGSTVLDPVTLKALGLTAAKRP
jgi:endoglucanase